MELTNFTVIGIWNRPNNSYLDWLRSGIKKYEGRTADKIVKWHLHLDKIIKFVNNENEDDFLYVRIVDFLYYDDFGKAYDDLGAELIPNSATTINQIEYTNRSRDEVIAMYNSFYDNRRYPAGETCPFIRNKGAVAIKVELIQ
jgi:ASC-1-like (ASCH) protein